MDSTSVIRVDGKVALVAGGGSGIGRAAAIALEMDIRSGKSIEDGIVTRMGHVNDCIAYGPGILELAHQPDEYVLGEDLVNSAKVMALTSMELLGTI